MARRYTVRTADLRKGAKIEQKEHPWLSPPRSRKLARDHLGEYGPGYYRAEPVTERVIGNINRKMGARPIRRKRPPRPFNPLTDNPFF